MELTYQGICNELLKVYYSLECPECLAMVTSKTAYADLVRYGVEQPVQTGYACGAFMIWRAAGPEVIKACGDYPRPKCDHCKGKGVKFRPKTDKSGNVVYQRHPTIHGEKRPEWDAYRCPKCNGDGRV